MKTVVLYGNRNTALCVLYYLVAKGYNVKLVTDGDPFMNKAAKTLNVQIVDLEDTGDYDLFICVHGRRILPKKLLKERKMINVHPTQYNGHNPVKRHIINGDTKSIIRVMYMTEAVDEGELIVKETFTTPICRTYADYYNCALKFYFIALDSAFQKIVA